MLEGRYRNHIKGGFLFGHGTYHRRVLGNNTSTSRFTTPTLLGLKNRGKSISLPFLVWSSTCPHSEHLIGCKTLI